MLRMMIAAAVVFAPSAASASAIRLSEDGSTARISYRDLNLGSATDRSKMSVRIRRAADLLCLDRFDVDPFLTGPRRADCYRVAVKNGVEQMNAIAGQAD